MAIEKILRRDGELAPFNRSRIENAIALACDAIGETDKSFIPELTDLIIADIEHVYTEIFVNRTPSVEDVQDIVEQNLVKTNRFELAKSYIIYRENRKREREAQTAIAIAKETTIQKRDEATQERERAFFTSIASINDVVGAIRMLVDENAERHEQVLAQNTEMIRTLQSMTENRLA